MLSVRRTARHFAYGLLAAFNRYLLFPMDGLFRAIHKELERFRCRYVGWALIELESEEEYPPLVPPPDWMPPNHEDATQSIPNQIQASRSILEYIMDPLEYALYWSYRGNLTPGDDNRPDPRFNS